ncbi:MAG: hypothetical protein K2W96_23540 [Gemmataceae bacterium]|nr:hypothetical protein [Gemmataceae bacterium]
MGSTLAVSRTGKTTGTTRQDWADAWPRTRGGSSKKNLSYEEKIHVLDPTSTQKATEARLVQFQQLFAPQFINGIVTREGEGHRAWKALRPPWPLSFQHYFRHLLADRHPYRPPIWIGARSYHNTRWFCLDVDPDRTAEQAFDDRFDRSLMDEDDQRRYLQQVKVEVEKKAVPPFTARCEQVEQAFRLLGIDPTNSRHVLSHPSPSGGRHYYLFLDPEDCTLTMPELWGLVGLRHVKGQIEFYPSTTQGFRLPFGHIPGQQHDPTAWIQFIDDYQNGVIKRFSVTDLLERAHRLNRPRREQRRSQAQPAVPPTSAGSKPGKQYVSGSAPLGIPKRDRWRADLEGKAIQRYRELLAQESHTFQDAEELWELGIKCPGTRNAALKILAAHLVWFRHLSKDEAEEQLTAWAYDPRHISNDIRDDLQHGKRKVADQIARMVRWYADNRQNRPKADTPQTLFARAELLALRAHITQLPAEERQDQAHFCLSFLRFAKLHGQPGTGQSGWDAAPAVKQVIRKWPGCGKMQYKARVQHAEEAGLFKMIKEKWQRRGGKGRARTYRIAVPVVLPEGWTLSYEEAVAFLTEGTVSEHASEAGNPAALPPGHDTNERDTSDVPTHRNEGRCGNPAERRADATDLRPPGSRGGLEPRSRERHQEPDATVGLPEQADGGVATISTRAASTRVAGEDSRRGLSFADRERIALGLSEDDREKHRTGGRAQRPRTARRGKHPVGACGLASGDRR